MYSTFAISVYAAATLALLAAALGFSFAYFITIFILMFIGTWVWLERPYVDRIIPGSVPELFVGAYLLPFLYFFDMVPYGLPFVIAEGWLRRAAREHNIKSIYVDFLYSTIVIIFAIYRLLKGF